MAEELTTRILIEIRDGIRTTNDRLDQTNQRLDQTNQRLDQTIVRLGDTNQRLSILATLTRGIDTRLNRMENSAAFMPRRVDVLEQKVQRIEASLGIED